MIERITRWLAGRLQGNWVSLLLFLGIITEMTYSVDEANWVQEDWAFLPAFVTGLLFGLLLARSRYRGWFAILYGLIISAVTAIEAVGKILPSLGGLFSMPFLETVNLMNLRAFELYLRVTGWVETYQAGETIQDPGLFILLLCFILGLSGVWLAWMFLRRRDALTGLLPIGLLFAVNIHLSHQPVLNYAIFLFFAILLIARTTFNRQIENWQHRRVDFPEQLGLEWSGAVLTLAFVIVLTARIAPTFGTPEGWQAIAEWLEPYEEQTSETAEKFFGGVKSPPDFDKPAIFTSTPNLREIGGSIPQGYETVMWVWTSDPPPVPDDVANYYPYVVTTIHYWRNGIFDTYTGRGWQEATLQDDAIVQQPLEEEPPEGRYYLRQIFEIVAGHSGALFSVNEPAQTGEGVSLHETEAAMDGGRLVAGQGKEYEVISLATRVTVSQLVTAPTDYPEDIRAAYLQLPDQLPGRVRALAERVVNGAADPYHKAINIQNYLRATFPYELRVEAAPERRDLVDYFLFDLKKGFCSHYASAMAVMLRSQGVPARVVTGYSMGEWDPDRGEYRVPVASSHAWVEVYFPGYGWVEFEPTAYRPPIEYPQGDSAERGPLAQIEVSGQQGPVIPLGTILLIVAAGLLLLALPFVLLRSFKGSRQSPDVQAALLYQRMRRALGWAGLASVPSLTPDEYMARHSAQLAPYRRLDEALRQATRLYRETVYSPHPPDKTRVRIASQMWQGSIREWLQLWARLAWERFRKP